MKLKHLLTSALVSAALFTGIASADTTYVLRGAKAGAGVAAWNDAVAATLNDKGMKTEVLGFNDCNGVSNWLKKNPEKQAISMVFSDLVLLNMIEPDNAAACDIPVNNDTLVGIAGKWNHFICGKEGTTLETLLQDTPKKIGSWNSPVQMKIVQEQMEDIGVKNFSLVGYASGRVQLQSFVSGDTDYVILSSEQLIPTGASCFATSGNAEFAQATNRTSYSTINENVRHKESGLWPLILGFNIDMEKVRPLFASGALKNEQLTALTANLMPVNDSIEEQVKDLNTRAENLK